MPWWLLPALIGGLFALAVIAWSEISDWFFEQSLEHEDAEVGVLVREHLASGRVRYVGGVFNRRNQQLESQVWEADEADQELVAMFGASDRIQVDL
jgi:hypothetical protein